MRGAASRYQGGTRTLLTQDHYEATSGPRPLVSAIPHAGARGDSPKGRASHLFSRLLASLRFRIGTELYKRRYRNLRPKFTVDGKVFGLEGNVASLAAFLERGNMEMFLKRFAELSFKLASEPSLIGRALFLPELDELARRASLVIGPPASTSTDSKLLVYIATEVYPTGGHTRVIEDIVAALTGYRHALILTNMRDFHPDLAALRPRFNELGLTIHLLREASWEEKSREFSALLSALRPQAILLFAHPQDVIANAGVPGHAAPRVVFLHHSDHKPSLGSGRTDYVHVDLTPACHRICASRPELRASLLNLTVKDRGTAKLVEQPSVVGVTCGSAYKYAGSSEFSYAQLLAALFSGGVDRLLHIGDMPASQKNQIRADIAAGGQDPRRVHFLPDTPSLAAKLIEISPHFYLTSHPLGGGKATVEALSVGVPTLYVCPASTLPLLNTDMTFGTAVPLSRLEQIPAALDRLRTEKHTLAGRSRAIYEKHYAPQAFREALLSAIAPAGVTAISEGRFDGLGADAQR